MFTDSQITVEKEVDFYSWISLVSDIGGALGLFLGFSFVMVWYKAVGYLKKIRQYWCKK